MEIAGLALGILGVLLTLIFSWQGSRAAKEQLRLSNMMLRSMESAGLVEWNRDSAGKIIGIIHKAEMRGEVKPVGTLTVTPIIANKANNPTQEKTEDTSR